MGIKNPIVFLIIGIRLMAFPYPKNKLFFNKEVFVKKLVILALVVGSISAYACSDFILPPSEGQPVVSVRTMDFNCSMWSYFVCSPRGYKYTGLTPDGMNGFEWQNKYGFISIDCVNIPVVEHLTKEMYCDGMNEEGLSVAVLWLDDALAPTPVRKDYSKVMCQMNMAGWILGTFSNVQQVIDAFDKDTPDVLVWMFNLGDLLQLPMHLVVHDKDNNSAIFEWLSTTTYRPVITTGAQYSYAMTNDTAKFDREYLQGKPIFSKLTASDPYNPLLEVFNLGGGSISLPGDSDSPSRWLRGYFTMPKVTPSNPAVDSWRIIQAFDAIRHVNTTYGEFYDPADDSSLASPYWFTDYGVIRDQTNKIFYFYSSRNQQLQVIKLSDWQKHMESGKTLEKISPLLTVFKDPVPVTSSAVAATSGVTKAKERVLMVPAPPPVEGLKNSKIYLYARESGGAILFWDGAAWIAPPAGAKDCPSVKEKLFVKGFLEVPIRGDTAAWQEAELHIGRGASFAEMSIEGRSVKVGGL